MAAFPRIPMSAETTKRKPSVTVDRIAVPKPHDVLANHLRESILRGEIPEGESLPSERDLVEQTGLTRGSVRAALRTLAVEGLVQTKHGRLGGSIVTLPGHESMASAIGRFVQGRRISLRSLQETREVLEPFLARLAAERRTEEHLQELQELHGRLVRSADDFRAFAVTNVQWHNAVAKASGNELLATLLYSIAHGVEVATMAEEYDTAETRKQVINIHARINEAIAARNSDLAERCMRLHMTASHARPLALASSDIPLTEEARAPRKSRATSRRTRK
jgi:GntR family transcriptional regulator, transcriptional repressor for pyruvate dehydrogenase complex